eukprot:504244-Prorocentrum_minimum.AAC.2
MVRLIAPVTNDSDVQDSQKLGSVRLDARSGTQDLSVLRPACYTGVLGRFEAYGEGRGGAIYEGEDSGGWQSDAGGGRSAAGGGTACLQGGRP